MSIFDWSTTAGSNSTVDGINIAEGCAAGNLNGGLRSVMANVRSAFSFALSGFFAGSSALPVANGGTGSTSASDARTALDVPSRSGSGASGTWSISVTGSAASATTGTTQSVADDSTNLATTAFVKDAAIGWSQTWQDVTGSRSAGSTYTNSTGVPIQLHIVCQNSVAATLTHNGIAFQVVNYSGSFQAWSNFNIIIPPGGTYTLSSGANLIQWLEFR